MIITVDYGHGTGQDRGAVGYLNEEKVIREYGPLVVTGLRNLGHTVYDCTPPETPALTLSQSLEYRVNKANYYKSDLHICMHVNAFKTDTAKGCEVEYISATGKVYADKVCSEISNSLGFVNRGSQLRTGLYVLKYTNMPSILIEPFFCDTKSDCDKYNAEKLADAIIKGITGQNVPSAQPVISKYDESVPTGNNIFPIPNTTGYVEQAKDGRIIIHKDRGNYIAIGKGFIDLYWNDNNGHAGSKRLSS